jgi:hypothetical protein
MASDSRSFEHSKLRGKIVLLPKILTLGVGFPARRGVLVASEALRKALSFAPILQMPSCPAGLPGLLGLNKTP